MKLCNLEVKHKVIIGIIVLLLYVGIGIFYCQSIDVDKELSRVEGTIIIIALLPALGLIIGLGMKLEEHFHNTLKE